MKEQKVEVKSKADSVDPNANVTPLMSGLKEPAESEKPEFTADQAKKFIDCVEPDVQDAAAFDLPPKPTHAEIVHTYYRKMP